MRQSGGRRGPRTVLNPINAAATAESTPAIKKAVTSLKVGGTGSRGPDAAWLELLKADQANQNIVRATPTNVT